MASYFVAIRNTDSCRNSTTQPSREVAPDAAEEKTIDEELWPSTKNIPALETICITYEKIQIKINATLLVYTEARLQRTIDYNIEKKVPSVS